MARTTAYSVEVPRGSRGGEEIEFVDSSGGEQLLRVVVPDGLSEGDVFEVQVEVHEPVEEAQGENECESRSHSAFNMVKAECDLDAAGAGGTPATEQLTVVVPDGAKPGESIQVFSSGGSCFLVEVPVGVHSGMEISVCVIDESSHEPPPAVNSQSSVQAAGSVEAPTCHDDASSSSSAPLGACASMRICEAEELRVPVPRPGYKFYVGQHIRMPRAAYPGFSEGVVLEIIDAYETLYRRKMPPQHQS